jgi:hypothetical protein
LKRYVLKPDSFLARVLKMLPLFRLPLLSLVVLLLFLLLTQLIYAGIGYLFPRVKVVDWGTIEHGQWVEVLMLRPEMVLSAPFTGEAYLLVEEGTRVRAGEAVAELIKTKAAPNLSKEDLLALRTIAFRLYHLDLEVGAINKELEILAEHNPNPVGKQEDRQFLTTRKTELLATRTRLSHNAETVLADWQSNYQLVVAAQPGIFSTHLDGGENLDLLEHHQIKTDLNQKTSVPRSFNSKLTAGKPWAKMVTEYTQTLVCQLPAGVNLDPPEEAVLLANGRRYQLSFLATDYTNRLWYFTENSLALELLEKRSFSAYLIYRSTTGLRVPRPALVYEEKKGWTVTTSVKGNKHCIEIEVVDMDDQWAIVQGLPLGTAIYYQ